MKYSFLDKTLALAGIFQATYAINEIATKGCVDANAFTTSLSTILNTSAPNVKAIYGNVLNLHHGLKTMLAFLDPKQKKQLTSITRYLLSLLAVEQRLKKDKAMQDCIRHKIKFAQSQVEFFNINHPNIIASLADIYTSTVGSYALRINITGKPQYLSTPQNMEKIRALLLAGLRSAVLWRQLGGKRLELLFSKKTIKKVTQEVLVDIS